LSGHLALPRRGHLDQAFHIFSNLNKYHNSELVFDPPEPDLNMDEFKTNWTSSEFGHIDGKEQVPDNMPEEGGIGFTVSA